MKHHKTNTKQHEHDMNGQYTRSIQYDIIMTHDGTPMNQHATQM